TAPREIVPRAAGLQRLALATAAFAYVQLVLGTFVRHLPEGTTLGQFRMYVVFHLIMAAFLTLHVLLLAFRIARSFRQERFLVRPAILLGGLLLLQLGLGGATWLTHYGPPSWLSGYSWAAAY